MFQAAENRLIAGRYRLETRLGAGGLFSVFRAYDRLTHQPVALKLVNAVQPSPRQTSIAPDQQTTPLISELERDTQSRLLLANEFRMLASLHHPHVIGVLDYGLDERQQPFFTMELLDPPTTILEAGQRPGTKLDRKVQFIIELLQALTYLHRHQIVHRDLKPGNVLVDQHSRIKLLDFGLAVKSPIQEVGYGGTLYYMSPEVMNSEPATEASDLYAVGVMAYELIVGRHPFNINRVAALMRDVLNTPPDLTPVAELAGDNLAQVVGRLLAKRAEDRYPDAQSVIHDIYRALNREVQPEDYLIRKSLLQSAPLVGRHEVLHQLEAALDNALAGQGSAWLISGEAGVGKTRLIEEIRVRALVKGMTVLGGQVGPDKNSSGSLWGGIIQSLALSTTLTDSEASVLKNLVPDIGQLIERQVADAPPVDDQSRHLTEVIAGIFRRQAKPILLILEDLYEDGENLLLLKALCRIAKTLSLMILASNCGDEQGYSSDKFPDMHAVKLGRLSVDEIAELTKGMLDSQDKKLINLLKKETKGNPLLIVEVLRTLADKAGGLAAISRIKHPARILAQGMTDIMRRRQAKVESSCPRPDCPDSGKVGAGNIIRYGKSANGKQRFRCKTCRHSFTEGKMRLKPDTRQIVMNENWVIFSEKASVKVADQSVPAPASAGC